MNSLKKQEPKNFKIIDPWPRKFNWILAVLYFSIRTPENVRNPIMTGQQLEIWGVQHLFNIQGTWSTSQQQNLGSCEHRSEHQPPLLSTPFWYQSNCMCSSVLWFCLPSTCLPRAPPDSCHSWLFSSHPLFTSLLLLLLQMNGSYKLPTLCILNFKLSVTVDSKILGHLEGCLP